MRATVAATVFLGVLALGAVARGEAGLVWQAPATCPDAAEVRARIERRLGMPIDRAVHDVTVDVTADGGPGGRGFVARIDLRAVTMANEIRVLTSARCDELTDAVAVVIARIAAEQRAPELELRRARPVAVPAPPPPSLPGLWGGGLRVLAISGVGGQPGVGLGGELAIFVRRGVGFAELAGVHWRPSGVALVPGAPGRVDVRLNLAALRLGWAPPTVPLRGWVAGELGELEGQGVGLNDPRIGTGAWLSVGAGFGVAWPIAHHVRIVGSVEVVALVRRARFVLRGGTELFRPDAEAARASLGFELGWP